MKWLARLAGACLIIGCAPQDYEITSTSDGGGAPAPQMVVDPLAIDFGGLNEGEQVVEAIRIRNEGTAPLALTGLELEGPGSFTLLTNLTLPLDLDLDGQIQVEVAYKATGINEAATLTVTGDDPVAPEQVVQLTGTWSVPALEITPSAVDFGQLPPNCEEATTILLKSVGTGPLTISSISLSGEGFTIEEVPDLPLVLEPDEVEALDLTFLPVNEGPYLSSLQVLSNDPAGAKLGELSGVGSASALCDGLMTYELEFEVDYKIADVAFLIDTTCSMSGTANAMAAEFQGIAAALEQKIPDITFGVATFDDYNHGGFGSGPDKPFILRQQQTNDFGRMQQVLSTQIVIHGGADGPESSMEALYQAASGNGYDQNCNGQFNSEDDVKPFLQSAGDAFGGNVQGAYDETVPGTGDRGGMGFREKIFPIILLATDNEMRDPEAGYGSPGGCSQDATFYNAYTGLAGIGAKFIGIQANEWGGSSSIGFSQMVDLAVVTGSFGDMDGDFDEEPAVVEWTGGSDAFQQLLVDAVYGLVGSAWFDKVELVVADDPQNLIVAIEPEAYYDVQAGTPITFTLTVEGAIVDAPTGDSVEVQLELVADDQIVLSRSTIFVVP